MGECILHGNGAGGGGLNFRVIGGTSAPASPKENDIWVNTSDKLTGFVFDTVDPSIYETELTCVNSLTGQYIGSSGMVYSNSSFNVSDYVALPKTTKKITVYHGSTASTNMYHAFYDASKTFISSVQRTNTTKEYSVPSNAAYVRLTLCTTGTPDKFTFLATVNDGSISEGMVWISTGTSSVAEFNALKKNSIQVYPLSAKQYVSGAWVDKPAKSYQNGKWVDWIPEGALYCDGDELTAKTGGWKAVSGTITKNADYFVVNKSSVVSTTNKISTVGYKTITVKALASGGTQWFGFGNSNNAFAVGQVELPTGSVGEVSIDLTSIQGSYYPIFAANEVSTINVYRVVMTK